MLIAKKGDAIKREACALVGQTRRLLNLTCVV